MIPKTLEWIGGEDGCLRLLDQTKLPESVEYRDCTTAEEVAEAILTLRVRGAPAIGVAGAYGLCLGARPFRAYPADELQRHVARLAEYMCAVRPTAVNLSWAVRQLATSAGSATGMSAARIWVAMLEQAHTLAREDAETCRQIGLAGAALIPEGGGVLTHCNAGALATVAHGTALALLYEAQRQGRQFKVFADETRPLWQGARLTAFELAAAGIDVTVICDSAAASLMATGAIQVAVVGADRIAANGDTANKIGTYGVAIAARHHGIPFYVAAPTSTFDLSIANGEGIRIEERSADEVRWAGDREVVAAGARCLNRAFDVTPAALISGIVTEKGVLEPVTEQRISDFFGDRGCIGRVSP